MDQTNWAVRWKKKRLRLALLVSVVRDDAEKSGNHAVSCIFPKIEHVRID